MPVSPAKSPANKQVDIGLSQEEKAREKKNKSLFANFVSEANAFFHVSDFSKAEASYTKV